GCLSRSQGGSISRRCGGRPTGLAGPDCSAVPGGNTLVRADGSLCRGQHLLVGVAATPAAPLAGCRSVLPRPREHPRSIASHDVDCDRHLPCLSHALHLHELLRALRLSAPGREGAARRVGIRPASPRPYSAFPFHSMTTRQPCESVLTTGAYAKRYADR